jgi:hypothetical protein
MAIENLTLEQARIKCRLILVDYHRRDDYDLTTAESDLAFTMQAFAAQVDAEQQKQCMYCEKTIKLSEGIFICKECSE